MELNKVLEFKPKEETMNFVGAIECIIYGNKINRLEWEDKEYYGMLKDGKLMLHKPDGLFYPWIISDGDLYGEDWVII